MTQSDSNFPSSERSAFSIAEPVTNARDFNEFLGWKLARLWSQEQNSERNRLSSDDELFGTSSQQS